MPFCTTTARFSVRRCASGCSSICILTLHWYFCHWYNYYARLFSLQTQQTMGQQSNYPTSLHFWYHVGLCPDRMVMLIFLWMGFFFFSFESIRKQNCIPRCKQLLIFSWSKDQVLTVLKNTEVSWKKGDRIWLTGQVRSIGIEYQC